MTDHSQGGNQSTAPLNPFSPARTAGGDINDGQPAAKPALSLQASLNTHLGVKSADSKPVRPAFPLYSSDIWSPSSQDAIKSAGLPQRPSWESLNSTPTRANVPPTGPHGSLTGLGLNNSSNDLLTTNRVQFTQTEAYHNSNNKCSFTNSHANGALAKSDPLPQHPFRASHESTAGSSNASNASAHSTGQGASTAGATRGALHVLTAAPRGDDMQSVSSGSNVIQETHALQHQGQADGKAEVWAERPHLNGLRRALKDPHAQWEEAYPGALTVLTAVNPEHFQMPFGTRVINIKTEFAPNIICSIRHGKYSCMEKVSERIMRVWEARALPSDKVLLLVSVNGSKRYSGIAEMSGPWDPSATIPGWEQNPESSPCVGSFPVTWVYIKDVGYTHFAHITQEHNGNPVGNMWNGMLFPTTTGRLVIEQYVRTPAGSSALGHPKNGNENLGTLPLRSYEGNSFGQRRNTVSRGGRGGGRGSFRAAGATPSSSWRQSASETTGEDLDTEDSTPMASKMTGKSVSQLVDPPKCDLPMAVNSKLQPGQVASVPVDSNGNLVFLPTSNDSSAQNSSVETSDLNVRGPQNPHLHDDYNAVHAQNVIGRGGEQAATPASRSYSTPKEFFDASGRSQTGLQHAASMGLLRSESNVSVPGNGGPVLPVSAPMRNFAQSFSPVQTSGADNWGKAGSISFGKVQSSQPTPSRTAQLIRQTPTSGALGHSVHDTPTHRPAPHTFRGGADSIRRHQPKREATDEHKTVNQLKAQWHLLCAEKFTLQDEASDPNLSNMNCRLLDAKMSRVLVEMRAVEVEMSMKGTTQQEQSSPSRCDSTHTEDLGFMVHSRGGQAGPGVSPVRAPDGRALCSASLAGSPLAGHDNFSDNGSFVSQIDHYGPQHPGHGSTSDWELRVKSIRDLVASPTNGQTAQMGFQSAQGRSAFFPNGNRGFESRESFSFHRDSIEGTVAQAGMQATQNYQFHGPNGVQIKPGSTGGGAAHLN